MRTTHSRFLKSLSSKSAFTIALTLASASFAQSSPSAAPKDDPALEALFSEGTSPATARDLPSTETSSIVNRPLLITSTLLFAGTWGTSIGFAYFSDRPEDQKYLYYPVAGPWLDYANRDCAARPCTNEGLNKALLIADGIGQGLGALGMVTSFFIPEKTTRHWHLIGADIIHAGPTRVGTGYGIGAMGRF